MKSASKTVAGLALLAVVSVASPDVARAEDTVLTVWINGDKGYVGLAKVGQRFFEKTGIRVVVEHPQDATAKFQQAAASGKGPDILIWPHDRLGELQSGGLIAEIKPGARIRRALEEKGWDAFTLGEKIWGYPIAFESVSLIYNKALIDRPPKTFEEIFALHESLAGRGVKTILWAYSNPYFTHGMLAAHGGYVFRRGADGSYDPGDIGVAHPGSVKGLEVVLDLLDRGVMPRGATYADAESAMLSGELAMMISGMWAWSDLRKKKIDFGVAPLPTISGQPCRPFVGVLGAMINQASPEFDLAVEFIEHYILDPEQLAVIDADKPIGIPAHRGFYRRLATNPLIRASVVNVKHGVLMPNHPAMGKFWSAMTSALENATQGRQGAREALEVAADRMAK